MRTWSTAEVTRLAGVTSRTLRHYDAIGLLEPAATGHGGLRRYGEGELLRLQQILLLRRLDLRLDVIAEILDGALPEVEALRRHAERLAEERERLDRLAATVADTIRQLEGRQTMTPETWFDGLEASRHEAEARRRWGDAAVDASDAAVRAMSDEERRAIPARFEDLHRRLAGLDAAGEAAASEAVQAVVEEHYRFIAKLWGTAPTAEAYKGLGALYTDDPAFTATFDEVAQNLAAYLREGMDAYADANL
ncbi:TipAS antibiotic-recognition domain-containing protein [Glycomyces sp. A-F 0318]|uniref:MerR family transcriptional regulator n=1 Tax=Glycomyces amatae TaxID=2881355 RepID=UPI001E45D678|nr:TipAS antibiotic-recognition domain-containing protein [Glycomyces amatae]MCD0444131.1 TipAS antibiotic-recognition domain-containing protein [Glycomyces amatae]